MAVVHHTSGSAPKLLHWRRLFWSGAKDAQSQARGRMRSENRGRKGRGIVMQSRTKKQNRRRFMNTDEV